MKNIFKGINLVLILKKKRCGQCPTRVYGRPHTARQAKPELVNPNAKATRVRSSTLYMVHI